MNTTRCEHTVQTGFNYYTGRVIYTPCGMTGPDGETALCESCEKKLVKRYPQGWRDTPGDICKHGNYVGSAGGPDFMCGYCENGE